MHLQVAVVVIKSGKTVDIFLQLGAVERAGVEEAAQKVMLARRHQPAQPARRERIVADELDGADFNQRSFAYVEYANRGVVGPGHCAKRDVGVEIALGLVDLAEGLDARLDELRIFDDPRVKLDRAHHLVGGGFYLAHPLGMNIGYQRPLFDVVGENRLAVLLIDAGVDVGEKAHPVNRLDVLVDDRVI